MAFLHCHSCGWSQDDFWEWIWTWKIWKFRPFGYNPISLILDDIKRYSKPEYIKYDREFAEENGFKSSKIHSWAMLIFEIKRHIKGILEMQWWTWKSWQKHKDHAVCPHCGKRDFDID